MRIAMIAPNYMNPQNGNAVTVRRLERALTHLGCEVRAFPIDCLPSEELLAAVRNFSPEILHAFHGYCGGRVAHALSSTLNIPYLVTLTGSDVYQALEDQRSFELHVVLRGAARVVVFHGCVKQRLAGHMPTIQERTQVIPQGVELPAPARLSAGEGKGFVFLLPAGLRPAKNVLFPLAPLTRLHAEHPEFKLHIVGPVRDAAYAAQVMDALERCPFAAYLGEVKHEVMPELYVKSSVVLNCSRFEGGMANSVLEALACGRPLLVSDIEGNRSLVKEGVTGLLYRDEEEFVAKAAKLMGDAQLRARLAKNGQDLVREKYTPEQEGRGYLELYREIAGERIQNLKGSSARITSDTSDENLIL